MKTNLFFIHGGPGLNSEPERQLLEKPLKNRGLAAYFWDEPSSQRPDSFAYSDDQAYSNWLKSLSLALEKTSPDIIVATSFGSLALSHLLQNSVQGQRTKALILIGPVVHLANTLQRMMRLSQADFSTSNPPLSLELEVCLKSTQKLWDQPMQKGIGLCYQNEKLLTHYFQSTEILLAWANFMQKEPYAIGFSIYECRSHRIGAANISKSNTGKHSYACHLRIP